MMLKKYVDQNKIDLLAYRIENECDAIAKGNILNRTSLDNAWSIKYDNEKKREEETVDFEKDGQANFKRRGRGR